MSQADDLQAGLDAMATVEAALVTFLGVARQRSLESALDLGEDTVIVLRAAQCQDEQHYHALVAAGGQSWTTDFTIPEEVLADRTVLLITLLELKAIAIAGHMALARLWAAAADQDWVEIAYQMGAVDAQHLALAHALVGVTPANDRAFARWLFAAPDEAIDALDRLTFLSGPGDPVAFPGPLERFCRGVFGLTPSTTTTMTQPRPPVGISSDEATPLANG